MKRLITIRYKMLKILVVGDVGIGKNTLLSQVANKMESQVSDTENKMGVLFFTHDTEVDGLNYRLILWNLIDDEKFNFLRPQLYKGAIGSIIIIDLNGSDPINSAKKHFITLHNHFKSIFSCTIVGNKKDLLADNDRIIEREKLKKFTEDNCGFYIESSFSDRDLFEEILKNLIRSLNGYQLINLLEKESNLDILLLLHVNREIGLTEMAKILKKSKSTISRNTRELKKLGIIKSYAKKGESTPGSIQKKYYKLNEDHFLFSKNINNSLNTNELSQFNGKIILIKIYNYILYKHAFKQFEILIEKFPKSVYGLFSSFLNYFFSLDVENKSENIINAFFEASLDFNFLSKDQILKIGNLRKEYNNKLGNILNERNRNNQEFLHVDINLPLLKLIEITRRKNS